jgi:hypothetical protein
MKVITERQWCVRFVGSYFSLITNVVAENEEQAEANAIAQLQDQHGLDMDFAGVFEVDVFDTENGENS